MRGWGLAALGLSSLVEPSRAAAAVALAAGQSEAPPAAPARLNTSGRDVPLGGPLLDNGFVLGEVSYVLGADDAIRIDAQTLLPPLQRILTPEAWQEIAAAIGQRQEMSATELAALGLTLDYDPATFGLRLSVPAAMRPRQAISISGGYEPLLASVEAPEDFSAYVTAFANADYVHRGTDRGLATPNILLDSAVRYRGFVLENEATVQDRFNREGTRLVYDDLRRTARYTAGDLEPIARGFSGATPMAGLSIVRVYADLEPQRNIQPRGQRTFTLVRPSTVETLINGRSVQQTRLEPGTYDIRDFPFAQGSNDVQLLIRDDAGIESRISFSINFDRNLLALGLTEFGLFAGVASPFAANGRRYTNDPVASGFIRRGLSDELTAGANFQAAKDGAVVGGEAVWASPFGTVGADLAVSRISGIGTGYALNLGYERILGTTRYGDRALVATFQTISKNFATPGTPTADNPFAYELGLTYSQAIGRNHYISTDAFYSIARGANQNQVSVRATYGWRPTPRLQFTAETVYEDRRGESGFGVRVAVTLRFGRSSSASAEFDSRRERARIGYQRSSGRGVGAYNGSINIERYDDASAVNGSLTATLNRAEVGLAHLTSLSNDNGSIVDQRTSLRVGTSIAFAGGHVAVARPIYDSFAILAPHRSLRNAPVYLEPRGESYLGRSGAFGGAVASELSAYSPQVLTYNAPDAPVGYDLGSGTLQFRPPYRSGHFVEIGSDYSVLYIGQLIGPDGAPVRMIAGQAFEEAAPGRSPVRMFTNQSGRFAASGLRPGRWRIEVPGANGPIVYRIDVPTGAQGLVRGGEVRPEAQR